MKDRISFSYAELNTMHSICASLFMKLAKLTSPNYTPRILPVDFEETNKDAQRIMGYLTIFMVKESIIGFKEINIQGIRDMKTCISLDRTCIEELYMSSTELFTFYKLHIKKFIPCTMTDWKRSGNHVQYTVETKEQSWFYQTTTHYLKLFAIYLNKDIPFKEKRERMLALDDEGPQIEDPIARDVRLSMG